MERLIYRIKIMWYNIVLRYRLKKKPYLDDVEDYNDFTEGI